MASDSGSRISRRPIWDRPTPEITLRRSNRSSLSGARGVGSDGSGTGLAERTPVGSNSGTLTGSWCSKRTCTSEPIPTSPDSSADGSTPTRLVVRRTDGSSSSATTAITYVGANPGSQWWALTV